MARFRTASTSRRGRPLGTGGPVGLTGGPELLPLLRRQVAPNHLDSRPEIVVSGRLTVGGHPKRTEDADVDTSFHGFECLFPPRRLRFSHVERQLPTSSDRSSIMATTRTTTTRAHDRKTRNPSGGAAETILKRPPVSVEYVEGDTNDDTIGGIAEQLAATDLLADLPSEAIRDLADRVDVRPLAPGTVLCREGDEGDSAHLVVSGRLQADAGGRVVGEIGRGELVGEVSLLTGKPRSATVTALRGQYGADPRRRRVRRDA